MILLTSADKTRERERDRSDTGASGVDPNSAADFVSPIESQSHGTVGSTNELVGLLGISGGMGREAGKESGKKKGKKNASNLGGFVAEVLREKAEVKAYIYASNSNSIFRERTLDLNMSVITDTDSSSMMR